MNVHMHVRMYLWMYVCMYIQYVCMYVYVCTKVYKCLHLREQQLPCLHPSLHLQVNPSLSLQCTHQSKGCVSDIKVLMLHCRTAPLVGISTLGQFCTCLGTLLTFLLALCISVILQWDLSNPTPGLFIGMRGICSINLHLCYAPVIKVKSHYAFKFTNYSFKTFQHST
jgi:hypothetical protein